MNHWREEEKVAQLHCLGVQPCNLITKNSLKTLAAKALQKNNPCNIGATKTPEMLHNIIESKYGFSLSKLQRFLGNDWDLCKGNYEALIAWCDLLYERKLMRRGQVPPSFNAMTFCKSCNQDVYIPASQANGGKVAGCPWCWNKAKYLPIPDPHNADNRIVAQNNPLFVG